jgi:glycerol-1-phosphate dehydrogenase [NAD(P)+]
MVYAPNALEEIPRALCSFTNGRHVGIVADQRTWRVAGERALESLEADGWRAQDIVLPDPEHGSPICDDATYAWLNRELPSVDIALAVGCGVVNDLVKWLAFDRDIPYAVVPTAATMNGFTAANVAPTLKGVKSILFARAPVAVFTAPSIIADAPSSLTAAGLGDVIAKPISTADWILNQFFHGEYFCQFCSELINGLEPLYFDRPEAIRDRQPGAIQALFDALLYSGIAMTIVGTSAPASGGEHLLSHTLDMMSGVDGVPHDLHGRQVGVGTLFASALYERIFRVETPALRALPPDIDGSLWGKLSGAVREQYALKKPLLETMRAKLQDPQAWQTFRAAAQPHVRSPQQIKDCLRDAGAAHTHPDIQCSRDRLRNALSHMHEIRKRPTVVDLAWLLGILPEATDAITDQWLSD